MQCDVRVVFSEETYKTPTEAVCLSAYHDLQHSLKNAIRLTLSIYMSLCTHMEKDGMGMKVLAAPDIRYRNMLFISRHFPNDSFVFLPSWDINVHRNCHFNCKNGICSWSATQINLGHGSLFKVKVAVWLHWLSCPYDRHTSHISGNWVACNMCVLNVGCHFSLNP